MNPKLGFQNILGTQCKQETSALKTTSVVIIYSMWTFDILIILVERAKPLVFVLLQSSYYRPFCGWFGPATWPLAHPSSATMLVAGVGSLELPNVCLPVEVLDLYSDHFTRYPCSNLFSTVFCLNPYYKPLACVTLDRIFHKLKFAVMQLGVCCHVCFYRKVSRCQN